MERLPVCDACGQPYEHHRLISTSADGRKTQITCVMSREGLIDPDQRVYVQALLLDAFQRQRGTNELTFVDKRQYDAVKKALEDEQKAVMELTEEHCRDLDKTRADSRLVEEELHKAEARAREIEKKVLAQKTDLIDTGRKLIVARDRLAPVEDENAKLRARNIELERLNATLEERLKHASNGVKNGEVKLPFTMLEDSKPTTKDKEDQ